MLIPPGKEIHLAKKYDPSIPQRVCLECSPILHPLQDELCDQYGKYQRENPHDAKSRVHVPYSSSLEKECRNAADIVGNFFSGKWGADTDQSIPIAFLEKAHGLALMSIVRAGFLVSGKVGTGLVIAKLPNGHWSAPSAIGTAGLSTGFEIGGELIELMIVLGSARAVKVFHKAQLNVGAGLDLTVGPYGRSAEAAAAASASGLNHNYSYSHTKGLYAGISLHGSVIATRRDVNEKFYGRNDLSVETILSGDVACPRAAEPLYDALARVMSGVRDHRARQDIKAQAPCPVCPCLVFRPHTTQIWNKKCKTCAHVHAL